MRSIESWFVAAAALAPMAGAASQETVGPTGIRVLIRDSAGIRIIENARPPEGSRLDWRLGPEPLVSIGRMDGEEPYLFGDVFGATMLSDGRIVIGDDGPKELRVFDRSGNHLETWGGRGEGPGEFGGGQLWGLAPLPGDSIMIWRFGYPELTVFGPDGEFLRRFIPERSRWDYWDRRSHLWPLDVSRDGLLLAGQDDVHFDPADVEVWDAGGELRGSLGAHPSRQLIREGDEYPGAVMFGDYVFRRTWGDLFVIGTNRRYEIRAFALDGSLARIIRMDHMLREPAEAHVEAYIGQRLSWIPSGRTDQLAERRKELHSMPVAEHLPAFANVRGDALNHLWVYEYEALGEEEPGTLATIFDPGGRVLGFFEIPEGMTILEIGADYILARTENDLGVHAVQLWALERGGSSVRESARRLPSDSTTGGEGPGEFGPNQLWGMASLPGDSIIVWHFWYPEVIVFGPDGEFLRRFMPERSLWDKVSRREHFWPLSVSRDGLVLAGQDILYVHPGAVEVWDAGGGLRGSLGKHPGQEVHSRDPEDNTPLIFARYAFRQPWGDLFVINTNHRYEFRAFALDGSLARIVRREHVLRKPTKALVEAYIENRVGPGDEDWRVRRRREYRSAPVAEHLPAFARVRSDPLGYLWVYEYEAPGEEQPGTLATVFDPEGRVLGFFETPEGMGILEIGADYILGRVENDLGVESVQLWPLERGG